MAVCAAACAQLALACQATTTSGSLASTPLLPVQGGGWAHTPEAVCADGEVNRQPFYWGMMQDTPPNTTAPSIALGVDISKVPGMYPTRHLCIYPAYWTGGAANRSWMSSPSAIWPALSGPYCDKSKDPHCVPQYLRSNGGCPQNISLQDHAAAVAEGIKVQVPEDFDGYVSWVSLVEPSFTERGRRHTRAHACRLQRAQTLRWLCCWLSRRTSKAGSRTLMGSCGRPIVCCVERTTARRSKPPGRPIT